jgi:shikimate kinase
LGRNAPHGRTLKNVRLIGMPGSGKSPSGAFAENPGAEFIDFESLVSGGRKLP